MDLMVLGELACSSSALNSTQRLLFLHHYSPSSPYTQSQPSYPPFNFTLPSQFPPHPPNPTRLSTGTDFANLGINNGQIK